MYELRIRALCVVLTARYRHVRKTVINQQFALVCVHVNQNSVRGLSLAAVAGDGVSVIEMRMLPEIESITTGVHPDFENAGMAYSPADFRLSRFAGVSPPLLADGSPQAKS